MEPNLRINENLLDVLEELKKREPIFHHPDVFGTTRADIEGMTIDSFWEVGASGRDVWETRDFHCFEIAKDNYLLTYTLAQGSRITCRSTVWRRCDSVWKIVYHQGTIVQD